MIIFWGSHIQNRIPKMQAWRKSTKEFYCTSVFTTAQVLTLKYNSYGFIASEYSIALHLKFMSIELSCVIFVQRRNAVINMDKNISAHDCEFCSLTRSSLEPPQNSRCYRQLFGQLQIWSWLRKSKWLKLCPIKLPFFFVCV